MSAAAILNTARRAGIRLSLKPDGAVRAEPTPPPDLLAELRANKEPIAALLATSIRSADLPFCPRCNGQRFWRSAAYGAVGDWTCVNVPVPVPHTIDILGPLHGEPAVVNCCPQDEIADADGFAETLVRWGRYIVLTRIRPRECLGVQGGGAP